jgi:hypothetical protein
MQAELSTITLHVDISNCIICGQSHKTQFVRTPTGKLEGHCFFTGKTLMLNLMLSVTRGPGVDDVKTDTITL